MFVHLLVRRKAGMSSWMVPRIRPEREEKCRYWLKGNPLPLTLTWFLLSKLLEFFPLVTSKSQDGWQYATDFFKKDGKWKETWLKKLGGSGIILSHTRNLTVRWVRVASAWETPRQKLRWVCVANAFGDVPS